MIRIVVIDCHPMLRHGLVELLKAREGYRVIGEAADCAGGCAMVACLEPDLIIFDLDLGDACGPDTLTHFRERFPDLRAIVYTSQTCTSAITAAVSGLIQGYVLKTSPVERFLEAIERVAEGGQYVDPALFNNLLGPVIPQPAAPTAPKLSARELEILRLVCAGMTNKEIARHTRICERTVKFHVSQIFRRLNARNRIEAARMAEDHGLLGPEPPRRPPVPEGQVRH